MEDKRPTGIWAFGLVWAGQVISLLGSSMTWFALTLWAWQTTGQVTTFALVSFFAFIPTLLFSPLAGALVDRWNRKWVMILSDFGATLATFIVLLLYLTHNLQIWHLYVVGTVGGVFLALQVPAYSAAMTLVLPKEHYARAEGLIELGQSLAGILAPLLAATLLGLLHLNGILLIDLFTFLIALVTLLWARLPEPRVMETRHVHRETLWQATLYGFRYIFRRRSLVALQTIFFFGNLLEACGSTLVAPMLLARTHNNQLMLGSVQSVGAMGGVLGGMLVGIWGGPRRKIHGILIGWALSNLLGIALMGLGSSFLVWATASFFFAFFTPIVNGSYQAILQSKITPAVQGRVFATKLLITQIPFPLAMLFVGPLADHVFEPALMPSGPLAASAGQLVGTGPGAGMALILLLAGLSGTLIVLAGYAFSSLRNIEELLPDYDRQVLRPVEARA